MRYFRIRIPIPHPGLLAGLSGLFAIAGALLWQLAQQAIPFAAVRLAGVAGLFIVTLVIAVILVERQVARPIHELAAYVKGQRDGSIDEAPARLLRRADEIGLLTGEIQRMLRTLKEQNERLVEQTLNDPLTGLGNRRLLDTRLDIALPMSRRRMLPVSALMIDVDHFKAYNDHYGHPAGDECLLEIANVLRDTFRRETDILIRLGGEEFLVVLLDVDMEESLRLAEAMRGMLQLVGIPHEKSSAAEVVTVSIGVATVEPGTPLDVEDLIACADSALYQCKASGRNCSIHRIVNAETLAA